MNKRKTLVVGASENADRFAYKAVSLLNSFEHPVFAFGIKAGRIGDITINTEFPTDMDIDTVTLYINPTLQPPYYDLIMALKPSRVIFNPGTENDLFEKMLVKNGIEPIEACTLVMLRTNQY